MTDDDVMEALTRAAIQLLTQDPFLGHVFGGLSRSVGEGRWPLVTEVTPRGFRVVASRSTFMALTERQRRVALEHELLHLVFRHCERSFAYREDAARFALACDLVVNQLLSQGMPLEDMVCLHHFDPPLPHDLTADAYYAMLLRPPCDGGPARCSGSMPNWGARCVGSSAEEEGDVPNPWAGQGSPAARQIAHALLDRLVYHAMLRVGTQECIGRFPGHVAEHLTGLIRRIEGVLDWRSALRRFAASSRRAESKTPCGAAASATGRCAGDLGAVRRVRLPDRRIRPRAGRSSQVSLDLDPQHRGDHRQRTPAIRASRADATDGLSASGAQSEHAEGASYAHVGNRIEIDDGTNITLFRLSENSQPRIDHR